MSFHPIGLQEASCARHIALPPNPPHSDPKHPGEILHFIFAPGSSMCLFKSNFLNKGGHNHCMHGHTTKRAPPHMRPQRPYIARKLEDGRCHGRKRPPRPHALENEAKVSEDRPHQLPHNTFISNLSTLQCPTTLPSTTRISCQGS